MERQPQSLAPQTQQTGPEAHGTPASERTYPKAAGLTARLALSGVPLYGMPPSQVEELAGTVGNSAMLELLSVRPRPVERAAFRMPAGEPNTAPFQIPSGGAVALAGPTGLAALPCPGAAADPGSLVL